MRLVFEDWIDSQNINTETKELFIEGIQCYKASAYRAALMFSWIGFQSMIRQKLLTSKEPVRYQPGEWRQKQKEISDLENWDDAVFEIVKQKKKPVIKISDDVYDQYMYWKQRRNDCAHAKGNLISSPHVESFWLFLQSNSHKFVVDGGLVHFLNDLKDHFDLKLTPPNTDIAPLIKQITASIELEYFNELLIQLVSLSNAMNRNSFLSEKWLTFWGELFKLPEAYFDIFIDFLVDADNKHFTSTLLAFKPDYIKYFNGKTTFIRSLWKGFSTAHSYSIFIHMIRHNLISCDQINEAFEHMIENVDSELFSLGMVSYEIDELDITCLDQKGFFEYFYKQAFKERKIINSGFEWGNRNKDLVIFYISKYGVDQTIALAIDDVQKKTSYPPRRLKKVLSNLFRESPEIKDKCDRFVVECNKGLKP